MTADTILSLLCKLTDTVDALQKQVDALTQQLADATADQQQEQP